MKQEYRIVQDGHNIYVIKADELQVFCHWEDAMKGKRHFPAHFKPKKIESVESIRFTEWREEKS